MSFWAGIIISSITHVTGTQHRIFPTVSVVYTSYSSELIIYNFNKILSKATLPKFSFFYSTALYYVFKKWWLIKWAISKHPFSLHEFSALQRHRKDFMTHYYLKLRQPVTATELCRAADIHRFKPHTPKHVCTAPVLASVTFCTELH